MAEQNNREQDRNGRSRDYNDPRDYAQRGYGQYARGSYAPRGREENAFDDDVEHRADWRNDERSSQGYQSNRGWDRQRANRFASPPDYRDSPYPQQTYGAQSYGYEPNRGQGYGRHFGRGPKNYTRSDERIQDDINDRLTSDHDVDATNIDVKVAQGEVTLAGTVEDRWEKRCAEDCAESVAGVRHVQNNIRVQSANGSESPTRKEGRQHR
ncbi:MAG: BON domain-containing protein [Hyphomonadaceae bacterium]